MNTQLQTFQFQSSQLTVMTDEHNALWFIAKEVAEILEYSDPFEMTKKLDDDEVQNLQIAGFGNRGVNIISESGLYSSILTSKKPAAKVFRKWVTSEVLPAIHKTGSYIDSSCPTPSALLYEIDDLKNELLSLYRARHQAEKATPQAASFGHRGWTTTQDQELLALRAEGHGWTAIGNKIGRSRETVRYRWHNLQAQQGGAL